MRPMGKMTLRLDDELHARLAAAAGGEHRSLHAEIVVRLERSFGGAASGGGEEPGKAATAVVAVPAPPPVEAADAAVLADPPAPARPEPTAQVRPDPRAQSVKRGRSLQQMIATGKPVSKAFVDRSDNWSIVCPLRKEHQEGIVCPHCKGSHP